MAQEQIKENAIEYIENNISDYSKQLEICKMILSNFSINCFNEGYISNANKITTCEQIIDEVLND